VYTSGPLRAGPPHALCGTDQVRLVAPTQLAVSESATACQAELQLTAQNGQQATIPVTIPDQSPIRPIRPTSPTDNISAVDSRLAADQWCLSATKQPPSPNQPQSFPGRTSHGQHEYRAAQA
jgi:hypothetical protein